MIKDQRLVSCARIVSEAFGFLVKCNLLRYWQWGSRATVIGVIRSTHINWMNLLPLSTWLLQNQCCLCAFVLSWKGTSIVHGLKITKVNSFHLFSYIFIVNRIYHITSLMALYCKRLAEASASGNPLLWQLSAQPCSKENEWQQS